MNCFDWNWILLNADPGIRGIGLLIIISYIRPGDVHNLRFVGDNFGEFIAKEMETITRNFYKTTLRFPYNNWNKQIWGSEWHQKCHTITTMTDYDVIIEIQDDQDMRSVHIAGPIQDVYLCAWLYNGDWSGPNEDILLKIKSDLSQQKDKVILGRIKKKHNFIINVVRVFKE